MLARICRPASTKKAAVELIKLHVDPSNEILGTYDDGPEYYCLYFAFRCGAFYRRFGRRCSVTLQEMDGYLCEI
jgi:hypothetical protein